MSVCYEVLLLFHTCSTVDDKQPETSLIFHELFHSKLNILI